jgi:hypothetical protein
LRDRQPPTQRIRNEFIRILGQFDLAIGACQAGALRAHVEPGQHLTQRSEQIKPASRGMALEGKTTTGWGKVGRALNGKSPRPYAIGGG